MWFGNRLKRYYHTVKHLQGKQIAYQLKYRIRKYFPERYTPQALELRRLSFNSFYLIPSQGKYSSTKNFSFLNLTKSFHQKVDWRFDDYGKLWNYNLQYFDFLFDSNLPDGEAKELIEDCAEELLTGKLPLEPYPVSLRLVNWLLYHSKTGYISQTFQNAISVQIRFLQKNPEHHIGGNHLLENYISLFVCSLYITDKSFEKAEEDFFDELNRQILPDGAHYECTPMYHIAILSRLYIIYALLVENNIKPKTAEKLKPFLSRMSGWLSAFQYGDSSFALFNDAAREIAVAPQGITRAANSYNIVPEIKVLKQSGYRKFTGSFGEVIVDAGAIIPPFQPGHAHSDMLSFTLFAQGREWLIDPGVSTYEKNNRRDQERSTFYHNTVTINNQNQSDVWGGFRVGKRAAIKIESEDEHSLIASHDGYLDNFGCIHKRQFEFNDSVEIRDNIIWRKGRSGVASANFYLDGAVKATSDFSYIVDESLEIQFDQATRSKMMGIEVPDGFNRYKKATHITVEFENTLVTKIRFR